MKGRPAGAAPARPPGDRSGTAQAGFTLLEATVALLVAGVGMAIAVGLLVQSQRMATQAALEIRAPDPEGPLDLLENELRAASDYGSGGRGRAAAPDGWSRDRLVLVLGDGTVVAYERDGDRLVRRVGEDGPARTVVPGLASWRWSALAPNLAGVEVTYDRGRLPSGGVVTPRGRRLAEPGRLVTRRFTVALRGAGGDRGW